MNFRVSTGFENVRLIHRATTRLNLKDLDLSTVLFKKRLSAPIIIGCMTGGFKGAEKINGLLARLAAELGIGMCVGSQRAALVNSDLASTFSIAREVGGDIFIMGNLGASQLKLFGVEGVKKAIEMIDADALAIHFNPVHEAVQINGTVDFSEWSPYLKNVTSNIDVPIVAKEIGYGFSKKDVEILESVGVSGLEVDGAGGTSWSAIEYYRALRHGDDLKASLAKAFWDWGIPTVIALLETVTNTRLPVIVGGGIRSGIDIAKSLALGAQCVAIARPILKTLIKDGYEAAKRLLLNYIEELKIAMFAVEAEKIEDLRIRPIVITGWVKEWLELRGINVTKLARRW